MANLPYKAPVGVPGIPTVGPLKTQKNMLANNRLQTRTKLGKPESAVATNPVGSEIKQALAQPGTAPNIGLNTPPVRGFLNDMNGAVKSVLPDAGKKLYDKVNPPLQPPLPPPGQTAKINRNTDLGNMAHEAKANAMNSAQRIIARPTPEKVVAKATNAISPLPGMGPLNTVVRGANALAQNSNLQSPLSTYRQGKYIEGKIKREGQQDFNAGNSPEGDYNKQSDISSILAKLKQYLTSPAAGAEFRSVSKAPGSSMLGSKLKPHTLYDPNTIHLLGKNKLQQRLLTGLDLGAPAVIAGSIQEGTGGMGRQENESWTNYMLRTTGAVASGLALNPIELATIKKRIPYIRMAQGQPGLTTATMKGTLGPLITKATVGGVGLAPSLFSDLKSFFGNAAGAAENVNKGTEGLDTGKAVRQIGEAGSGIAAGSQGASNALNQLPKLLREQTEAQLKAQAEQGKGLQDAVKPIGDFANTLNGMATWTKNNAGYIAGAGAAGIGGVILANRLMKMRENIAKENTKQMALNRPASTKKRKLVIDPGDYDIDIKNFQVSPEHGIY